LTAKWKRAIVGGGLSLALLAPCFWQPRIEAGDLSSHVYNAWLAQLIERGQAPGLALVRQTNNVLFDLMLSGLMRGVGITAAQRISVSVAVLIFFWGAFAFVRSSARPRRAPWQLVPCLAMLTYGWVFRMGLFNFYMALGLAFGALAAARRNRRWAWALAAVLAVAGYVAHPLPVIWASGMLVYERVAQALRPRQRSGLMIAMLVVLALAGIAVGIFFETRRGIDQLAATTGAEQVWVYGKPYVAMSVALLAVWVLCFFRVARRRGAGRLVLDVRFQLWALTGAALVLLPAGVLLPGYRSGLDFVAERMSLAGAVLLCGMLASWRLPEPLVGATVVLAVAFFARSYVDERQFNGLETRMERVVAQLPPGQRVVSALADPGIRIPVEVHMIDRVCVGRCFSYANYEPCTWQFRVRAKGPNSIVVSNYGDSWDLQNGQYRVKRQDLPMYKVGRCGTAGGGLCVAALEPGDTLQGSGRRPVNQGERSLSASSRR